MKHVFSSFICFFSILLITFSFTGCGKKEGGEILSRDDMEKSASEFQKIKLKTKLDVSGSTINYFDASAIDTSSSFKIAEDDTPFTIVDYGPMEELPHENKRPTIYVVFSQPVVPIAKLGAPMTKSPIMSLSPEVPGVFRWYGTKLLSFEPDEDVMPQKQYTVTIDPSVTSLGGKKLEGENSFSFHSEYLKMLSITPGYDDVPLEECRKILVTFSYPVNHQVIKKYIKVITGSGEYDFTISEPERGDGTNEWMDDDLFNRTIVLNMKEEFEENTQVRVILSKGARSEEDFLGTPASERLLFHTLKPFVYSNYSTYSYSFPRSSKGDSNPVYIRFSHPVDKESALAAVSTSFNLPDLAEHIEVWGKSVKISNLPVSYNSSYTITVNPGLKDIYGRQLGTTKSVEIFVDNARSYSHFPNTGTRMLEAAFDPNIIFEYQNVFQGRWKIDTIDEPYTSFSARQLGPYNFEGLKENVKHYEIVDLKPYLNDSGYGYVGLSWNFHKEQKDWGQKNLQVQVTDLGITTRYAYNKIIVMAASLSTGKPVEGAKVYLMKDYKTKKEGVTDKEGIAVFPLSAGEYKNVFYSTYDDTYHARIKVEHGDDKAEFIPNYSHNAYHFGIYSQKSPLEVQNADVQVFLFTDRGLYKPGESVTYRGIDRTLRLGNYSIYQGNYKLEVKSSAYRAKPFFTDSGTTTASGGFYGSFTLPEDIEPGYYRIAYTRGGVTRYESFQIANFRRLNFQVKVTKPDITHYKGDKLSMSIEASYLAGGAMGGGSYSYYWTAESLYFTPPGTNWKSYRFGPSDYDSRRTLTSDKGILDGAGKASVSQDTKGVDVKKGLTYRYTLNARVEDIDRQVIQGSRSAVVHPAAFYLGLKFKSDKSGWWSTFVEKGKKVDTDYVLVSPDGKLIGNLPEKSTATMRLYRVEWKVAQQKGVYGRVNSRYERVETRETEQEISLNKADGTFSFTPEKAGSYILELECTDEKGRSALSRLRFYATGSEWIRWGADDAADINLIADRNEYTPGDTVKLLIQSPLPKGRYLVTIEREGILEEKVITLEGSASVIDIPVKEEYLPVFYVAVSSYSKREGEVSKSYFEPDLGKPKSYFGITRMLVTTESKEIDLEIISDKKTYGPGETAGYTIRATRDGKPVSGAEITFMAVDRGVIDLINYHVPDPVKFFYDPYKFPLGVYGADSRTLLIDPVTYEMKDLHGGDGEEPDDKMKKRKDFRPTAVFEPYLVTDKKGEAKVSFTLPDTLTTYRCTAMGVQEDLFGLSESETMVKNPINVRTALTRRLRLRDTSVAGVIVTNLDSKKHEVSVSAESDILLIDGDKEKKVTLPPNSVAEVPFKLLAVQEGEAVLTFTIRSAVLNEQLEDKLIIERPLIKEAFTTIGQVEDSPKEEGVILPSAIAPGYGGMSIRLDSTKLSTLAGSIDYLYEYPYGCFEQRSSKIFPLVLFGEDVNNFIKVDNVKKTVENELAFWAKYQFSNGGFSYWPGGRYPGIYISCKIAKVLHFAKENGYKIPSGIKMDRLLEYIGMFDTYTSLYEKNYSFYVRSLYGKQIATALKQHFEKNKDSMSVGDYGLMGMAFLNSGNKELAKECFKRMKNLIKVGTQSIDIVNPEGSYPYYFNGEISQLAAYLMFFHQYDKNNHMIVKLVNTLINRQKGGYWRNTYTTEWVIQAFYQVYKDEAGTKTDYEAKVLFNNKSLLTGRLTGVTETSIAEDFLFDADPLKDVKRDTLLPLRFEKEGKGSLYYTVTMRYALPMEIVPARDEGFTIYTSVEDLEGNKLEKDELKLGETYRMKAVISTSKTRNFVAVRVPVPSGAEILDSSFATTASYEDKEKQKNSRADDEYGYRWYYWYRSRPKQNIYDNEVHYFYNYFQAGKQEVEFIFRVTTPGIYPTPSATVECMYEEEVFGRNDGKLYVIKPE